MHNLMAGILDYRDARGYSVNSTKIKENMSSPMIHRRSTMLSEVLTNIETIQIRSTGLYTQSARLLCTHRETSKYLSFKYGTAPDLTSGIAQVEQMNYGETRWQSGQAS